jgi:hypothetical protein
VIAPLLTVADSHPERQPSSSSLKRFKQVSVIYGENQVRRSEADGAHRGTKQRARHQQWRMCGDHVQRGGDRRQDHHADAQDKSVIRAATASDLQSICTLGQEIQRQHHVAFPTVFGERLEPGNNAPQWLSSIGGPDTGTFVAESDGQFAGFITANDIPADDVG